MLDRIVRLVFPSISKTPNVAKESPVAQFLLDGRENPCHLNEVAIVYHRPGFAACFWKKSNSISVKTWGETSRIPLPKEDYMELQITVARLNNPRLAKWYKMILKHLSEKAAAEKKAAEKKEELRPPLRIPGP